MSRSKPYKSPFFVSFLGTLLILSSIFLFLYGSAVFYSVPREKLPDNPSVRIQNWMHFIPLDQDIRSVAYINSQALSMYINRSLPIFTLYFSSTDLYLDNLTYVVKVGLYIPSADKEVGIYILGLKDEFIPTINSSLAAKGVVLVEKSPFTIYKLVVNASRSLKDGYASLRGDRLFLSIGDKSSMTAVEEFLYSLSYDKNMFEEKTVKRILYAITEGKEDYIGLSFLLFPGQIKDSLMTTKAVFLDDKTVITNLGLVFKDEDTAVKNFDRIKFVYSGAENYIVKDNIVVVTQRYNMSMLVREVIGT